MINKKYFHITAFIEKKLKKLKGPIIVFGAGGFIGANLLYVLLLYRKDVYGVSRDIKNNWRFNELKIAKKNLIQGNILVQDEVEKIIKKIKPRTIFNLSAYGAYSKQKDVLNIYQTNFIATVELLELLKTYGFDAYIHAGSSSEYGLNSNKPAESGKLLPNSHYAVSKLNVAHLLHYYGKLEALPVIHTRLYAVYGPYEEQDRLITNLIQHARFKKFPPFASSTISRDFIYTTDVISAFITLAYSMNKKFYGEVFNIGTGKKTTLRKLVALAKKLFAIQEDAIFKSAEHKNWDHGKAWYANIKRMQKVFHWNPKINLKDGLQMVRQWQTERERVKQ